MLRRGGRIVIGFIGCGGVLGLTYVQRYTTSVFLAMVAASNLREASAVLPSH
jgi:hypothetical protein